MKSSDSRLSCREARAGFRSMTQSPAAPRSNGSHLEIERHVDDCSPCAAEYGLFEMEQAVLDASAAAVPVEPDQAFFAALRARIHREAETGGAGCYAQDAWANMVWVTARQLIPTMAVLLILIIGATLIWGGRDDSYQEAVIRPSERVLFHDIYDTPQPTRDDVLEMLVAVEEKDNGK